MVITNRFYEDDVHKIAETLLASDLRYRLGIFGVSQHCVGRVQDRGKLTLECHSP